MTLGSQFSALVVKNFKTRFRGWSGTLCELAIPVIVLWIAYLMQLIIAVEKPKDTFYPSVDVISYSPSIKMPIIYIPTCPALTKMFAKGRNASSVPDAVGFKTVEEGYSFINLTRNLRRMVVFEEESCSSENIPKNLKFKVVIDWDLDPEKIYGESKAYHRSGIQSLNYYITSMFINYWQSELNLKRTSFHLNVSVMPVPERHTVPLRHQVVDFVCGNIFFIFLTMASYAGKSFVEERELKLKETMSLMGMNKIVYWLAWFFMNFLWSSVLIAVTIIISCVNISGNGRLFLANPVILIALMMLLALEMLTFCLALSCLIKKSVKSTCLGISLKECFRLLGQNGAEKTTTFKKLTGDVVITEGDIYVESNNIKWYLKSIQSRMGYCPQYDALRDLHTGPETLFLYGRLRGVPEKELLVVAARVVKFVNLHPHEIELTRGYSGGTKRKLSLDIGNPVFIMLNEPTAGMDPISRRTVWEVLNFIRKSGRTLILTSHSMEECAALCTHIAIMGNGQVLCLGSPQYLKNKYGQGLTVVIYATVVDRGQIVALEDTIQFIINKFTDSEIFNQMESYVHFQVPETGRSLADMFETLPQAEDQFKFSRYTVQQTSLEQVFLMFMKKTQGV